MHCQRRAFLAALSHLRNETGIILCIKATQKGLATVLFAFVGARFNQRLGWRLLPAYSISNLKQHEFLLWERPPGRDKLDRGQEAAPTKAPLLN